MPEEFLRCVRALRAKGKDRDSAYAICTEQYQKKHGVSPQQAAGEAKLEELMSEMERDQEAQWTTGYVNDLPDSCFAWIEDGGTKDEEGKTVPRSLRHLPYKDKDGTVDLPHLRNALARAVQMGNVPAAAMSKLHAAAKAAGVGQAGEVDVEPPVVRSIREEAVIAEAEFDDTSQTFQLDVIRAGVTKNGKREYTAEALAAAVPRYVGAQMYLDHSTETEDRERPARSVRDLAAVIEGARYEDGVIRATARVLDPTWFPKLKTCWPYIGISADQMVRGRKAEAGGRERLIIEAIEDVRCVDFVTRANAGGAIRRIIESYDKTEREVTDLDIKELTVEQLREARPDLITDLTKATERAEALTEARVKEMIETAVKAAKESADDGAIKQVAREVALIRSEKRWSPMVKDAKLHPAVEEKVRARLVECVEDDEEKLRPEVEKIVTEERDYAARLTKGVRGMGGIEEPDEQEPDEAAREALDKKVEAGQKKFAEG